MSRPILVTGAHRSGTTWVGKMLALSPEIGLIHEPFSPVTAPGVSGAPFERFFVYVTEENEERYVQPLKRTLAFSYDVRRQVRSLRSPQDVVRSVADFSSFARSRARGARPLLKDPIAVFSSEWIASRFGAQVVVLARHPAAFASSLKRFGWRHDFTGFLDQPLLLRDHLGPFESEIRRLAARDHDVIDEAILLWRLIYGTVLTFQRRHADWVFLRHEDLSRDPLAGFSSLYESLGLELTPEIASAIDRHTNAKNPTELRERHGVSVDSRANVDSWRRRLDPDEIRRIRAGVADVAPSFYLDEDW